MIIVYHIAPQTLRRGGYQGEVSFVSIIVAARTQSVSVSDRTVWWHVLLETDDGLNGIGEATHESIADGFAARFRAAAERLVGRELTDCMRPTRFRGPGDFEQRTIHSALSQAVCDLAGQQQGVPVRQILGATPGSVVVPLYANINRASRNRSAETIAKNAAAAAKEGFDAIKIAAFDDLSPEICGTPQGLEAINCGLERLAAVADAAAGVDVMVDCHWRFAPAQIQSLIPALKEIGVSWLECPLREVEQNIADLVQLRKVANEAGIRLCGLETFGGWVDVAPFVTAGAYDVIMPDVKHAGSLRTIVELASRAADHKVAVSLHNPTGPIAHFYSEQLAAVIDTGERLEIQWRESPQFFELTDPPPDLSDGVCRPSDRPGLGAKLADRPAISPSTPGRADSGAASRKREVSQ